VNGSVVPRANDGLAGVTASVTRDGCPTFSVAEFVVVPELAVMVALPTPAPVANPVLATVATAAEEELQLAVPVRSCVLLSLYVPVAVNCWLIPFAIEAFAGVTDREVRTAGATVSTAKLLMLFDAAVIFVVPLATLVARPPLLTVATEVAEELHVAVLVRFCVVALL